MQTRHFEKIVFSARAAATALVAALLYKLFHLPGSPWVAAVSAITVTQPDLHTSVKASLMRVVANLTGAFGGAGLSIVLGEPLAAMAIGILITGVVCYYLKQDDMMRPAFVAVVIVTLTDEKGDWHGPMNRVSAVIIGCGCALVLGFLFDKLANLLKPPAKDGKKGSEDAE